MPLRSRLVRLVRLRSVVLVASLVPVQLLHQIAVLRGGHREPPSLHGQRLQDARPVVQVLRLLLVHPAIAATSSVAAGGAGAAAAEEKKEEKKDEEEDVDMGGLFGDDDDY